MPVVGLGAELKPTRRHAENGAGVLVFDAALLGGFAFGGEARLAVPVIGGRVGVRFAGEHRQYLNLGADSDGVRDGGTQ